MRRPEAGFTMIEVMIAVLLTAIAVIGVVGLFRVQTSSAGHSRLSTEASVLAADKMEQLRIVATPVTGGPETIDARGMAAAGPYTRSWTVVADPPGPATQTGWKITVVVEWPDDEDADLLPESMSLISLRGM